MANFHATTRASLKAVKATVMGAEYYVEPSDDDEEAQDHAAFISQNLFDSPSVPWLVTLGRILNFVEYGFSIMEPVF